MTIGFPTNTVLLIVVTMVVLGGGVWLGFSQTLQTVDTSARTRRFWRWGAALVLSGWLLARFVLIANSGTGVVDPYIVVTFGLLALVGIVPLLISPVFRQVVRAVPITWLTGIHAVRLEGFFFLALLDMKLLPAEFALPAGYGDMLAGVLALVAVYLFVTKSVHARGFAIVATLWGLLDLVVAVISGTHYLPSFVTQLYAAGASPAYINYVLLVPSFAVPLLIFLHVYSLMRLLSAPSITVRSTDKLHPELG